MLRHEHLAWSQGSLLIGIDEVGRGPLAGPVVAAAVCFPIDHPGIAGVRDSKKVPKHEERVRLVQLIQSEALAWGLGAASVREIARDNIRRATALAMRRALQRCRAHLDDGVVTTIMCAPDDDPRRVRSKPRRGASPCTPRTDSGREAW